MIYNECYPRQQLGLDKPLFVNVEGPEYSQDYSYFVVHLQKTIAQLEQGIPLNSVDQFKAEVTSRHQQMEWRIMTRITLHQDHVKNLQILDLTSFKE